MKARPLAVILLVAGCAAGGTGDGLSDVQRIVSERSGSRVVRWRDADGADLDSAVRRLLDGDPLTADAAVQVALLRNPRLQALYEDVGIAQADLVRAGLLRNPVFEGTVHFGQHGPPDLAFGVAQEFLSVLVLPLRRQVAAAQFEAAKFRVAAGVLDVEAETREAFHRLQAESQLLEMREQVRTATSASHDVAKALHDAGNVRDLDVDAERALFARAQLAVAASQSAVASARERLNVAMGLWGRDTAWKVPARLPDVPGDAPDLTDVERRAVGASLELGRLRAEIAVAARTAEAQGASRGADEAEVGGSAEREDGEWEFGPSVKLPLPIFDLGHARVAGAVARLRRREMELRAAAVEIRAAARAAAQRYVTARAAAQFHRDEVLPLRTRIVDATQLQYNAMQVGVFQLLAVKQQQIEAGQAYVEALREHWLARAELEHILRGGRPRRAFAAADVAPRDGGGDGGHAAAPLAEDDD